MAGEYEVVTYSFGDKLEKGLNFSYNSKQTDFTNLFDEINKRYSNRNVGALIIASDGIYNTGKNPRFAYSGAEYPVYSIALGDSNLQRDIILSDVIYNKISFLGNKFPLQILILANDFKGSNTKLTVYNNNVNLYSEDILITDINFSKTINLQLTTDKSGLQHIRIAVTPLKEETNLKNNTKDIVIDVISSRQKILILANSPHPDIGAIKRALSQKPNYEVNSFLLDDFNQSIFDYNLVILHQLPSLTNSATNVLSNITKTGISALYILGGQSDMNKINTLGTGFQVRNGALRHGAESAHSKFNFDESQPSINDKFNLFEISKDANRFFNNAPPLIAPFGDYSVPANAALLSYQKINNISTTKPLIFFFQTNEAKYGFIAGEGLWRWRINNYAINANYEFFDDLLNKIVQYLSLKLNKDDFIVNTRRIYNENEPVIFEAEIYNQSFELVNKEEVNLQIVNSSDKMFSYIFNRTDNAYRLNAGVFPPGDYIYRAHTTINNIDKIKNGTFSIVPVNIETKNTVADHQLLYQLSNDNRGKLIYPSQIPELINIIKSSSDISSVSYTEKQLMDIIHIKWIFFILVILVAAEWLMRKYFGSY
ncbi:MAG: hypothetical protein HY738_04600 [Bacteroidia bacterium]|nr:hypothetical protein [Bacteroidia bacterium]